MSLADELITRGWTQERAEDDEGRVCLSGAAAYASSIWTNSDLRVCDTLHEQYSIYMQILATVIRRRSGYLASVVTFNDTAGRTFDEVLRVAKEADEVIDYLKQLNEATSGD